MTSGSKKVLAAVGGLVVVGVAVFLVLGERSKESEVDSAVENLGRVAQGIEATNDAQRAAGRLGQGDYASAVELGEESAESLADLRTEAGGDGSDPSVTRALSQAERTSVEVTLLARALGEARRSSRAAEAESVRRARERLRNSERAVRRLNAQFDRAKGLFRSAIRSLTSELEALGSLSDEARLAAQAASGSVAEPTPPTLGRQVRAQYEIQAGLLTSRLEWIEPRPGPRSCGSSDSGTEVIVNSGAVSCQEAFFVLDNSSGPNGSTAPSGWDCSAFAVDLEGNEIPSTAGYGCTGPGGETISFVAGGFVSGAGGSQQLASFQSPSGNIGCRMDASGARCDISEKIYEPPYRPSTCDLDWGNSLEVTSGPGEVICAGDTVKDPSAPVLEFGQTSTIGSISCTSSQEGVACENLDTGHGFTISRESISTS